MTEKDIDSEGRVIRRAINITRKKAPDNLKHRVMHQIIQEEALKSKHKSASRASSTNVLKDFLGVFGAMYAILILLVIGAYFINGKDSLMSTQFVYIMILVCFVFGIFGLIVAVDGRRKHK